MAQLLKARLTTKNIRIIVKTKCIFSKCGVQFTGQPLQCHRVDEAKRKGDGTDRLQYLYNHFQIKGIQNKSSTRWHPCIPKTRPGSTTWECSHRISQRPPKRKQCWAVETLPALRRTNASSLRSAIFEEEGNEPWPCEVTSSVSPPPKLYWTLSHEPARDSPLFG